MTPTTEPRLALPSRAAARESADALTRAGDMLGEFRRELAGIRKTVERINDDRENTLQDLVGSLSSCGPYGGYNQDTAAMPYTLNNANSAMPITLNRILLNETYRTQGLIRTLVDVPVEDAFRGGLKFKSSELDEEELTKLNRRFKRKQNRMGRTALDRAEASSGYDAEKSDQEAVKSVGKWARLFGGSGLIVNTDQNFTTPLNLDAIREDSPLEFISADRWELILQNVNLYDALVQTPFNYYGLPLHRSRVATMIWSEAPSWSRPRLQGWGMSILEETIRAVSSYLKFEKLLFELLDEAKIDVYKIKGFTTALASPKGTELIQRRLSLANQAKNFQSALTMDMEDDYVQKQLTFSGIADIYEQLRTNLCAYIRFPKNKLFGESAGGFGSGKDSLDNYNSTVGVVRDQLEPIALKVGELRCQQLFGMIPEDLEVEWAPLDVLDGVEQESVKTSKQARIVAQFTAGLLSGEEACESLQKEGLLLVECEVLLGLREVEPPMTENPGQADAAADRAIKVAKAKPAPAGNRGGKA